MGGVADGRPPPDHLGHGRRQVTQALQQRLVDLATDLVVDGCGQQEPRGDLALEGLGRGHRHLNISAAAGI
jgi:hypothetical protein